MYFKTISVASLIDVWYCIGWIKDSVKRVTEK